MPQDLPYKNTPYPAIYDFSILPYALGDVLTWNIKSCIRTQMSGKKELDIYLCTDRENPSGLHQKFHIHQDNYELHMFELMPAFYCNPMLRNVHLFSDRKSFGDALEVLKTQDEGCKYACDEHAHLLNNSALFNGSNIALQHMVSTHEDINLFYSKTGGIPKLTAPKGCVQEAEEFRRRIGNDRFVVTVNFRMRSTDPTLGVTELHRDANFNVWYRFFELIQRKFPDVVFLLLGKVQEKRLMLLRLDHVICPRLCGFNLGHELALIHSSDMFMGSSSGFAAMANFTDVPYIITKMNEGACKNYGIPMGHPQLPFANPNQKLIYEEESVDLLIKEFALIYTNYRKTAKEKARVRSRSSVKTSILFRTLAQLDCEIKNHILSTMEQACALADKKAYASALKLLDDFMGDHSDVVNRIPNFHLTRGMILQKMDRLPEALHAAQAELACQPENRPAIHFRDTIEVILRQKGELK